MVNHTAWCWTWYHSNAPSKEIMMERFSRDLRHKYTVFQLELCPTTNRLHWQGYSEFNCQLSMREVKRIVLDQTIHLGSRLGTRDEAREYCMKEDTRVEGPTEVGVWAPVAQGKRTDLDAVKEYIIANPFCTDMDLMDNFFSLSARHLDFFRKFRAARQPKRTEMPEVYIFYGASGTGKSRLAHEMAPDAYVKPPGKWWDGYDGQADVICDDFYGTAHMPYPEFLKVCDRYRHTVEVKGGVVHLDNVKRIFFTSNLAPTLWFNLEKEYNSVAFSRRIHVVKFFINAENVVEQSVDELFGVIEL